MGFGQISTGMRGIVGNAATSVGLPKRAVMAYVFPCRKIAEAAEVHFPVIRGVSVVRSMINTSALTYKTTHSIAVTAERSATRSLRQSTGKSSAVAITVDA
jgi:hypothetical protein